MHSPPESQSASAKELMLLTPPGTKGITETGAGLGGVWHVPGAHKGP